MKNSIGNFKNEKFNDFNGIIYDPKCMCIGSLGKGKHIRCFKLSELKKELVPINAVIKAFKMNGEKIIKMYY